MKYVVFDLDQTMADLHTYFFPLIALHHTPVPFEQLDHAYTSFVYRMMRAEASDHPLGLLRPGLLSVMEELAARRHRREIHPITIYSNNNFLPCLQLVRDIINSYVGILLIDQIVHRDHPSRLVDQIDPSFTKTWDSLKVILRRPTLSPTEVLFFDDQDHPHLRIILGSNYHQVTPYRHASSFERVSGLLLAALEDASVDEDMVFQAVYASLQSTAWTSRTLKELVEEFRGVLGQTEDTAPMGHCAEFWNALQEYQPEWYM